MPVKAQKAEADQDAAEQRCPERIEILDHQKALLQLGNDGNAGNGDEGLDRKAEAEALEGQVVERKIDNEEQDAEGNVERIMQQEGDAGRAAGEEPDLVQQVKT